ncbi:hypothetical protein L0244_35030, partial [bacterium]|nr:hypothetical protein [bacterium]
VATNREGREIHPPTNNIISIELEFERYARLLARQDKAEENQKQLNTINNLTIKNQNQMKTQKQNPQFKKQKENQLRFIEYEKPTGDGHLITISDSYHNVLGRIHRTYNDQTKKYEYVAFDHAGNVMAQSEKVWEVKNVYVNNRAQLLEAAHQRRIESKQQARTVAPEKTQAKQPAKTQERKTEMENLRQGKTGRSMQSEKSVAETVTKTDDRTESKADSRANDGDNSYTDDSQSWQEEREQELEDLRDSQDDDRGDRDIDF